MKKSAGVQIMRVYFLFFHQIKCNKIDFAVKNLVSNFKTWSLEIQSGHKKFNVNQQQFKLHNVEQTVLLCSYVCV